MRQAIIVVALLLAAAPSWAQPCAPALPREVAFDPYKPSDLVIVRSYGAAVMSRAPLDTLLRLDPYVPIQRELLSQVGGAIPWWPSPGVGWYPTASHGGPCVPAREPSTEPPPSPPVTSFQEMLRRLPPRAPGAAPARAAPERRSREISVSYAGRWWISDGPAIPFSDATFERVGESAGFAVFRRRDGDARVIYLPTTPGMVAPFRADS